MKLSSLHRSYFFLFLSSDGNFSFDTAHNISHHACSQVQDLICDVSLSQPHFRRVRLTLFHDCESTFDGRIVILICEDYPRDEEVPIDCEAK